MRLMNILLSISMLSFIALFYFYGDLPDTMNTPGLFDELYNKFPRIAFIVLAIFPLFIYGTARILQRVVPHEENTLKKIRFYSLVFPMTMAMSVLFFWLYMAIALGFEINIIVHSKVWAAILLITLGNYLPRIKHKSIFGFITPWTKKDETVWKKTHRVAGRAYVLFGFMALLLIPLDLKLSLIIFWTIFVLVPVALTFYSQILFKKRGTDND